MSFPVYPEYKNSGVDWLGEVPTDWDIAALRRRVELRTERAESTRNQIALEDIESWTGRLSRQDGEFASAGIAFEEGDVLYGKLRPYLAKVYASNFAGEAVGDFHVVRPDSELSPEFLSYALRTRGVVGELDGATHGSKMPRVGWEVFGSLKLTFPSLREQRAIAAFLDRETVRIDAAIAAQRRLIELLAEKRQATISHAVTKGLNPDAPMKDSGIEWLGKIPAHWKVSRAATLFIEINQPSDEERPVLSVSIHHGVSDGEVDDEDQTRKSSEVTTGRNTRQSKLVTSYIT